MRRSLRWLLASTLLASAVAFWLEPDVKLPASAARTRDANAAAPGATAASDPFANWRSSAVTTSTAASDTTPLPHELPDRDVTAGQRDIFTPTPEPSALVEVTAPPPPAAPSAAAPPSPPPAPHMLWRASGAMTTPDGQRLAWLTKGNGEVSVSKGFQLEDGYVVQNIDQEAVVLLYPALGTTSTVPLPQGPP